MFRSLKELEALLSLSLYAISLTRRVTTSFCSSSLVSVLVVLGSARSWNSTRATALTAARSYCMHGSDDIFIALAGKHYPIHLQNLVEQKKPTKQQQPVQRLDYLLLLESITDTDWRHQPMKRQPLIKWPIYRSFPGKKERKKERSVSFPVYPSSLLLFLLAGIIEHYPW